MNRITLLMLIGSALTLTGFTATSLAQESEEDESKYIEEIIVTGELLRERTLPALQPFSISKNSSKQYTLFPHKERSKVLSNQGDLKVVSKRLN